MNNVTWINTETNGEILTKLVNTELEEVGIKDKELGRKISYVIHKYHDNLLKYNKIFELRRIVRAFKDFKYE